mmetsp:Transcript_60439/g.107716  ORF Transcript_60439/g.107716 Transcript_60439/m.107716 type:complete len:483 (+) Transcript_60439:125-1573(+)
MAHFLLSKNTVMELISSVGIELAIFVATLVFAFALRWAGFMNNESGGCAKSLEAAEKTSGQPKREASGDDVSEVQKGNHQSQTRRAAQNDSKTVARELARQVEKMVACGTRGQATDALSMYEELRRLGQLRAIKMHSRISATEIYGVLLQCVGRAKRPELIEKLIIDMRRADIERPLTFYESTMKLLASKKCYQEAMAVYTQLELDGLEPSPVTLSCLINFAAELGELECAIGFFQRLSSVSMPSIRAYMTVLRVHSKRQDWPSTMKVIRDMQQRQAHIDSLALNIALATGVAAGDLAGARALLNEASNFQPPICDVISHNTIMKGYAQQKEADEALKLLQQMDDKGVRPNAITFNTAMDAAVRGSKHTEAWHVLAKMRAAGCSTDKFTCTTLMKGLQEGATSQQLSVFLDLLKCIKSDCDPELSSFLFRSTVEAAVRVEDGHLAARAVQQMREQGIAFSHNDYQRLLQVPIDGNSRTLCES